MPGKVNPTQCEAVVMVAAQVLGNDAAIAIAGAGGAFELNTYRPLFAHAALQSARLLADAMDGFRVHCAAGISPNRARIDALMRSSLMLVTALQPHVGYFIWLASIVATGISSIGRMHDRDDKEARERELLTLMHEASRDP